MAVIPSAATMRQLLAAARRVQDTPQPGDLLGPEDSRPGIFEIRRCELVEPLTQGDSETDNKADAVQVYFEDDGTEVVDSEGETFEIRDHRKQATGVEGDRFMVAKLHDAEWWDILGGGGAQLIGKLDGALAQGGSATVSIWTGAGGSESDSGKNIVAYDWLMKTGADNIATGKKVVVTIINGVPYVTEAECP